MDKNNNNPGKRPKSPSVTVADMRVLRRRMPPMFRDMVVERLRQEHGREVSRNWVSMQFNEPKDLVIIGIMAEIAEAHEQHIAQLRARVRGEKQTA